ncbi:MAG: hypothetical protein K9L56_15210, partial [Clostridiales bacterium]|nr:hypothetical protein [Clostridiales bacterium]
TKAAVLNKTLFAFGEGVTGPTGEDADLLRDWWNDPQNQASMFSVPRQYERSNQLLCDGDLFLLLFVSPDGSVQIRRQEPLAIHNIITDPEDTSRPLYYVAKVDEKKLDAKEGRLKSTGNTKLIYYRDYNNTDPNEDPLYQQVPDFDEDTFMMHVPLNRVQEGAFGVSEAAPAAKWFLRAQQIADDQATISKATARLMSEIIVEGSAGDVDNVAQMIANKMGDTTDDLHEDPDEQIFTAHTPNVEMKQNRAGTGSSDAFKNSRMMRMPGAAQMGQSLHYLADPENANLATATSMELPVLKNFSGYQSIWQWTYRSMADFVLRVNGHDPEDVAYDIPMSRILREEISNPVQGLLDAGAMNHLNDEYVTRKLLEMFGSEDIHQDMKDALEQTDSTEPAAAALEYEPTMGDVPE